MFPILPQFTEAFVQALGVSDGLVSDSGLKMEILKVERPYGMLYRLRLSASRLYRCLSRHSKRTFLKTNSVDILTF